MRNTKQITIQKGKTSKLLKPFGIDVWNLFRISDLRFGICLLGFSFPSSTARAALAAILLAAGHSISLAANSNTAGDPKSAGSDPFRVPDGTADDLQKYIENLESVTRPLRVRGLPTAPNSTATRCRRNWPLPEKLLTVKPVPTPDQVRIALRAKVAALLVLEKLGDATATDKIEATIQQARQLTCRCRRLPGKQRPDNQPRALPAKLLGPPRLVRDVEFTVLEGRAQQAAAMNANQFGQLVARVAQFLKHGEPDGDCADVAIQTAMAGEAASRAARLRSPSVYRVRHDPGEQRRR